MVDGTGAPRRRTGVAITQGRIAEVGKVSDGARRVIDASDLIVFVDPHTHYDAKICSDPLVTCASWHGVTSVVWATAGWESHRAGPHSAKPRLGIWSMSKASRSTCSPRHPLGMGKLPRLHGSSGPARVGAQPRLLRSSDPVSPLCDGRGFDASRGASREPLKSNSSSSKPWPLAQWVFPPLTSASIWATRICQSPAGRPAARSSPPMPTRWGTRKGTIEIQLAQEFSSISDNEYAFLDLLLASQPNWRYRAPTAGC